MCTAASQQFCVRWNSHLGSLGSAFPEFLAGQNFVDVTLACEGHQLHCHRLILASCSSYFSSLLRENPCKHPIIILPRDIKLWEIQALVDFMYKGHVNVSQTGLPDLLKSAEILQIRGLSGSEAAFNLNQSGSITGITSGTQNITMPLLTSFNGVNDTIPHNESISTNATTSPNSSSSSANEIKTNLSAHHHNRNIENQFPNNITKNLNDQREASCYEENNGLALVPTTENKIVSTKEEPPEPEEDIDETINDDSMNAQSESSTQEDECPLEKYSDFLNRTEKEQTLQYRNQTKQQEQEPNYRNQQQKSQIVHQLKQTKKLMNIRKSVMKQSKSQEQGKIAINLATKCFNTSSTSKIGNNDNSNRITINNDSNTMVEMCSTKSLKSKGLSIFSYISSSKEANSNSKNNNQEISEMTSDSSDADIFIVEPEIPVIDISDDFDENTANHSLRNKSENIHFEKVSIPTSTFIEIKRNTEISNNDSINNSNSEKFDETNVGEINTFQVAIDKNRFNAIQLPQSSPNSKSHNGCGYNPKDCNFSEKELRIMSEFSSKSKSRAELMKNSKIMLSKKSVDKNYHIVFDEMKRSNNGKNNKNMTSTLSRNAKMILPVSESHSLMLPPSLKFNSQSMSIYVKKTSEQSINATSDSTTVTNPLSEHIGLTHILCHNIQQKNQNHQSNMDTNDYFGPVKTEYEIQSCDNNYESIICSPNVNALYDSSEGLQSDFVVSDPLTSVNYENIQIDDDYYDNSVNFRSTEVENHSNSFNYNFDEQNRNNVKKEWPTSIKSAVTVKRICSNHNNFDEKTKYTSCGNSSKNVEFTPLDNSATENTPSLTSKMRPLSTTLNFVNDSTPSPSAVILRNPRHNQPRSYSTDALYAALMDVKAGESIYRASQIHKVPRKTLRNWMKRWHIKSAYPMPKQLKQAAEKKKLKLLKK